MLLSNTNERLDYFFPTRYSPHKYSINPRIVLMDEDGTFPLVTHGQHDGLPGGHALVKERKRYPRFNMLNVLHLAPTLIRESHEELGVDIAPYISRAEHLGIAAVEVLRFSKRRILFSNMLAPILFLRVPRMDYSKRAKRVSCSDLPIQLYPDAAFAISRMKHLNLDTKAGQPIHPIYLNGNVYAVFIFDPKEGNLIRYFYPDS